MCVCVCVCVCVCFPPFYINIFNITTAKTHIPEEVPYKSELRNSYVMFTILWPK